MAWNVQIQLKLPKGFDDISGFKRHMSKSMVQVAREGRDYWRTLAGQRLRSSREKYRKAVKVFGSTDKGFSIGIDGKENPHIVAMEVGSDPYELHPNTEYGKIIPLNANPKTGKSYIHQEKVAAKNLTFVKKTRKWMHPGFDGFEMHKDVKKELATEILPKYITEAVKKALEGQ